MAPVHAFICDKRQVRAGRWALLVSALCLLLCACGTSAGVNTPPPSGWTDITPPDSGQLALYAVSPDVPGLMLATIGGHAQTSADPLPAARLWRSQDGGASWQSLDSLSTASGSELYMPPGGHGLVFTQNSLDASVSVSADAGTTWRKLPFVTTAYTSMSSEWDWLASSVAIGDHLYAGGVAAGFDGMPDGTNRFSVSDDHGFTWRAIETDADPAGADTSAKALAPLDATGSAWLRLVMVGQDNPDNYPNRIALERSTDGGASWSILNPSLTPGTGMIAGLLSADVGHPNEVCAALTSYAFSIPSSGAAFRGGAAIVGPAPAQQDIALLASDDGGKTWRGGRVVALRRQYGGAMPAGVRMSANGSCYLATSQSDGVIPPLPDEVATLWRLAPGATTARHVFTITGRGVQSLALAPAGSGASGATGERLVALTRISGPGDGQQISCGDGCQTYRDGGIYRLIWEPLPAA